ncbi:MAG: bifunctional cytidylyltransferase/SDR family oxidoreductase [Sulfurovum sp.]|nr:bifunctional cytidylyltransferase/SDR family oxidoreductase [Sulfurovum sp.]MCB4764564.1 bifunctional cytidylyltransferase/SDR family oxidoreductase [Sulfurovum sp.]MCB4778831.1 bifunctional cytidylyltransferase/SDR family oxidoreductase [Sulfurovum sp.]
MKNIAVILAGGIGSRLGYSKPKQFIKVAGKMIIEHTVEIFQKYNEIDEIAIVCHKDYIDTVESIVISNHFNKVKKILNGGSERHESSLAAIDAYDEECNLIFHDAVRPLVSNMIIGDTVKALSQYNAIDVVVPATDTIIQTDGELITDIPNRDVLRRGQTPQGFKRSIIKKAYDIALKDDHFKATDDCGIVKTYLPNEPIFLVRGEESNMKLTYEEDLFLLDKFFQLKSMEIVDNDKQALHLLDGKTIVVFGGSYGIGREIVKIAKQYNAKVYSFSRSETKTDISDIENVNKALQIVVEECGNIDYIINTAGVLDKEPLLNMNYETIEKAVSINYMGNIIIAKESFDYLKKSKGKLLFFTSSSYTRGRAMYSTYSSLKAATVNFVQAIASEWGNFGIQINCINPERTLTPMRIKSFGKEDPKTLLSAKEVAISSLKTLLTDISGQVIDVKKGAE